MIVLDTNVLSELMRASPAPAVVSWMRRQPTTSLYTTAVTEAELRLGVRLLAPSRRRRQLEEALRGVFEEDLAGRVLPFGSDAAQEFANIVSERKAKGRPIAQLDAQIAAIARSVGASIATRNIADFDRCGVALVDPWGG